MQNKKERQKEQILRMSGVNPRKCMRCGKCSGTCPSYDEMEYHPHQFVYMVENGDLEALMKSDSIYKCLSCFACVDRWRRASQAGGGHAADGHSGKGREPPDARRYSGIAGRGNAPAGHYERPAQVF